VCVGIVAVLTDEEGKSKGDSARLRRDADTSPSPSLPPPSAPTRPPVKLGIISARSSLERLTTMPSFSRGASSAWSRGLCRYWHYGCIAMAAVG